MFAKDNDHRQDLEELSKFIDELRSERWKKDQEMDKLLNQLIDLEDAVEQQIAVKVSFEFISSIVTRYFSNSRSMRENYSKKK
jgi:hypothetical protein